MARPTSKPRLHALTPDDVGAEAHRLVLEHLSRQAMRIGCTIDEVGPSDLALTAADLTRYAQTGDTGDWGAADGALDAAQSICEALYAQAGVPGTFETGELAEDADPETPIGLVLVAAFGRMAIEQKKKVPVRQLAALSGIDYKSLELLARKGELSLEDGQVSSAEARRWLSGRGVPGFEARKRGGMRG